jgi:para-aminobenzoate synthetase component I
MDLSPVIPLVEEFSTRRTAFDLFESLAGRRYSFFLDSAMDHQKLGRYSLMGCEPFLVFRSEGKNVTREEEGCLLHDQENPLEALEIYLSRYRVAKDSLNLPCYGGAVGYLSYDLGRVIEELPGKAVNDLQLPESCLGFYDVILVYDHLTGQAYIISTGFPETETRARSRKAIERLGEFKRWLAVRNPPVSKSITPAGLPSEPQSNFTRDAYVQAVEKARRYIIDGDIFEVNLSQRYCAEIDMQPLELYRRLRRINPAPFAAYLNMADLQLVSSSPERFLRVQGDRIETRPIKGTMRRGSNPVEDEANARWLMSSEKDHAENIMIVDLERNDLGRICRYGTVKVSELVILEKYPTVFHLTSTVVGQLKESTNRADILKATFPGGSISGAPKIRAMEIIDELEPVRRSVYTGSIGYFSFDGDLDLNIVIRTFLVKDRQAYFQLGGAIVYDSDPQIEYRETLDKGRALFKALSAGEK